MNSQQDLPTGPTSNSPKPIAITPVHRLLEYKDAVYYGPLNGKGKPSGTGILIYDSGNLYIGEFRFGVPSGRYFFFQNMGSGLCFYGRAHNKKLEGANYCYSRNNATVMAEFHKGSLSAPHFNLKNKHPEEDGRLARESARSQSFTLPTEFLNLHFRVSEEVGFQPSHFQTFDMVRNQVYFGVLEEGKPAGCGVIFLEDWPVCYGKFRQGKLYGQARVEENPLLVLDGLFDNSEMKMGWVINLKQGSLAFGKKQKERKIFQLTQEFSSIDSRLIESFWRQLHMRSVFFANNYAPSFDPKQAWPQNYLNQLAHEEAIKDVKHNFNPSHISDISRVVDYSSNRVERDLVDLIADHESQTNSHTKISKILESRLRDYESRKSRSKSKSIDRIKPVSSSSNKSVSRGKRMVNLDRIYSKHLRRGQS